MIQVTRRTAHEVTGLARSDTAAAAVSALGAKVRRGDLEDLDGLKEAAAEMSPANELFRIPINATE